mmetsp:Transcript_34500/g.55578  ORF Transcript_34500/g.55578 Transcript_34500/m.55578 type:complete len:96 (+) Transcript_34500:398-685(+)|eukprot:1321433-Amorphochlora_amoeboformis.AAC.1
MQRLQHRPDNLDNSITVRIHMVDGEDGDEEADEGETKGDAKPEAEGEGIVVGAGVVGEVDKCNVVEVEDNHDYNDDLERINALMRIRMMMIINLL